MILAGVPEEKVKINDVETDIDREKVEEVLKVVEAQNIRVMNSHRIGKKG